MISFRGIKSAPSLASCGCEEGLGGTSTVRQEIFLDVIAVGLEQHVGTAQLANLFFGPLDHAVALARLLIEDLARGGHFEALLGARFGLHLGHFALQVSPPAKPAVAIVTIALHFACLICGRALSPENRYPLSGIMLLSTSPPATAALISRAAGARVMAEPTRVCKFSEQLQGSRRRPSGRAVLFTSARWGESSPPDFDSAVASHRVGAQAPPDDRTPRAGEWDPNLKVRYPLTPTPPLGRGKDVRPECLRQLGNELRVVGL